MEQIKIKSGPTEIISTGTIISFEKNPIEIVIGPSDFKIILKFNDEEGAKGDSSDLRIVAKQIDNVTLEVTFFNFIDPLGTGNLEPAQIGKIGGYKIYFNYRIYPLKDSDKTIHYTIYKKKVISND